MSTELVPPSSKSPGPVANRKQLKPPAIVERAGNAARFAWDEFFKGEVRNEHTRKAYTLAVRRFLEWCEAMDVELTRITPGMVGEYFNHYPGSPATRKQHLSAVRSLFDKLVTRHAVLLNPARSVRTERYQVIEGKTPEITVEQARTLLRSLDATDVVGLRDRAFIGILIYTAARVGAVCKLRLKNFQHDGSQWCLRFDEKGGKEARQNRSTVSVCMLLQFISWRTHSLRSSKRSTSLSNRSWMSGLAASGPPWRLDRSAGAVSSGSPRPPGSHGPLSERA